MKIVPTIAGVLVLTVLSSIGGTANSQIVISFPDEWTRDTAPATTDDRAAARERERAAAAERERAAAQRAQDQTRNDQVRAQEQASRRDALRQQAENLRHMQELRARRAADEAQRPGCFDGDPATQCPTDGHAARGSPQ